CSRPLLGRSRGEDRVQTLPDFLGGAHLVEEVVVNLQQAQLFEVGRGDAPAAAQVVVDPVADDVAQGRVDVALRQKLGGRIDRILGWIQLQFVDNLLGDDV